MRGEVVSLSRNIKIVGEETDDWGVQVLTADIMDEEGTFFEGKSWIEGVEIQYGGQKDTRRAAVRFEGAVAKGQIFKNSVVHEGPGWAMNAIRSKGIMVDNNVFWGANQVGVGWNMVMESTFNNNFVGWVDPRTDLNAIGMATLDVMGGALFCSLEYPSACPGIRITNNICAGTVQQAFTGPAHDCGKKNSNFFGNVAHSISGGLSGNGFVVYPDPSKPAHKDCYEVSQNAAYKCADAGIFTNFPSKKVNMHSVTAIDCNIGAGAMAAVDGAAEYKEHSSHLYDSIFYGSSVSPDCPDKEKQCKLMERSGVTTSIQSKVHSPMGMELHPKKDMHCPISSQVENGSWAGKAYFRNLKFIDFAPSSDSKGTLLRNTMIQLLKKSPDFITMQHFDNIEFINCESDALTYFFNPPQSWANLADCGDFPCTGPKNTIFSFTNIKWTGGKQGANALKDFSLIPDIKTYSDKFPDCTKFEKINGYQCTNNDLGILIWESLDPDSIDRSIQPIYIWYNLYGVAETKGIQSPANYYKPVKAQKENKDYKNGVNILNSYMDHNCDSFYNSQQRISRFPGLVYAPPKETITVDEAGKSTTTPGPGPMKYWVQ